MTIPDLVCVCLCLSAANKFLSLLLLNQFKIGGQNQGNYPIFMLKAGCGNIRDGLNV